MALIAGRVRRSSTCCRVLRRLLIGGGIPRGGAENKGSAAWKTKWADMMEGSEGERVERSQGGQSSHESQKVLSPRLNIFDVELICIQGPFSFFLFFFLKKEKVPADTKS